MAMAELAPVNHDEIYSQISRILAEIDDEETHIRDSIIPKMDVRGGRTEPLTLAEVEERLSSLEGRKRREEHEWADEVTKPDFIYATGPTPEVALEIADLTYYYLQPNANPQKISVLNYVFHGLYGISPKYLMRLCIVKYETRMVYGDRGDFEQVEEEVMRRYLDNTPELQNLWPIQN